MVGSHSEFCCSWLEDVSWAVFIFVFLHGYLLVFSDSLRLLTVLFRILGKHSFRIARIFSIARSMVLLI